jgi:hypothetical protein
MNSAAGHSASREERIHRRDALERAQDRIAPVSEAVVEHPLDLADPDRHPGELGGIRVDLDPQDRLRADAGELLGDPEDEGAPPDGLELEVLERLKGDVQEVARATGGIEDADRPEARAAGAG